MMAWWQVHLWETIWGWELHHEAHRLWHLVYGKCWTKHMWVPGFFFFFFYLVFQDWAAEDSLWEGDRRHEHHGVYGAFRNGKSSKKITIFNCRQILLTYGSCSSGEHPHSICYQYSVTSAIIELFGFYIILIPFQG